MVITQLMNGVTAAGGSLVVVGATVAGYLGAVWHNQLKIKQMQDVGEEGKKNEEIGGDGVVGEEEQKAQAQQPHAPAKEQVKDPMEQLRQQMKEHSQ